MFGDQPDVIAPQAARPCNPFQSNLALGGAYAGFSWYLGEDPALPEAASFGDALAELDLFVETQGRPFVVVGEGQGGALALALAIHAPARLVAVWAQAATLPSIQGWTPPRRDLSNVELALADWTCAERTAAEDFLVARGARIRMFADSRSSESARWLQSLKIANTTPTEEQRGD